MQTFDKPSINPVNIGIIGNGAWGSALAQSLANSGHRPLVWGLNKNEISINNGVCTHTRYPDISLHPSIQWTTHLNDLKGCEILLSVIPAQATEDFWHKHSSFFDKLMCMVLCSKGLSIKKECLVSHTLPLSIQEKLAVLSGPNFAKSVAKGLPAAATLAMKHDEKAQAIQRLWDPQYLRLYRTSDIIGVQVAAAIKNVLAIACGVLMAKELGPNALCALITRGLSEMMRLGVAMGAKVETFTGLSGVGDLFLTCTSAMSRNTQLGIHLGNGLSLTECLEKSQGISEGVYTAKVIRNMGKKYRVDMPICAHVSQLLEGVINLDEAIDNLLTKQRYLEETVL